MTQLQEAFEHNPNNKAFRDFFEASPATHELNPNMYDEHKHLEMLHGRPRNPGGTKRIRAHTRSSHVLNKGLMYDSPEKFHQQMSNELTDALQDSIHPLEHEHHVYSGLGAFSPEKLMQHSNGIFKAKHFISTSLDPGIATQHDNLRGMIADNPHTHVLHFHLPKGYDKSRYIAHISHFPGEHEMLMDRDQTWKLTNVHTIHSPDMKSSRTIWSVKPHETNNVQELYKPWDKKKFDSALKAAHPRGYLTDPSPWSTEHYKQPKESDRQHDHLNKLFESHFNGHEHEEDIHRAIKHYVEGGSSYINPALIENRMPEDGDAHERIAKAFENVPALDHEVHVYSGVGFDPEKHFNEQGGKFHSPAYLSTSLNPHVAIGIGAAHAPFYSNQNKQDPIHVLHFKLPKGYARSIYAGNSDVNRYYTKQRELILDKDQKYKKTGEIHTTAKIKTYGDYNSHPVIIHTVEPYESHIKEEVEHHGELYFDDVDTNPKPFLAHPNKEQFEFHENELSRAVVNKMPPQRTNSPLKTPDHVLGVYSRGSSHINSALLGEMHEMDLKAFKHNHNIPPLEMADRVSESIAKYSQPTNNTLHVYSGTTHPHLLNGITNVGDVIHTPAFTSTSIHHNVAKEFGWNKVDPDAPAASNAHHVIHFELPPGYNKGAYIKPHSWLPHEHEYLLDKNQKWKITNHEIFKTRDPGSARRNIVDRHVWTVVPHEPKPLTEALVHVPQLMKPSRIYVSSDVKHQHKKQVQNIVKKGVEARELRDNLGNVHHNHLIEHNSFEPDEDERAVIAAYTTTHARPINKRLIAGHDIHAYPDGYDETAVHLSEIIDKHKAPLKQESHFYSGVGFDPSEHFKAGNGVLHTPAFMSTSINPDIALDFGMNTRKKGLTQEHEIKAKDPSNNTVRREATHEWDHHIIHFKLPKGYKNGLYIQPHSKIKYEQEYLLDKGQKWKLEKHEILRGSASERHIEPNMVIDNAKPIRVINKTKIRRHIWTVVPHDDHKGVTEGLEHRPDLFKRRQVLLTGLDATERVPQSLNSRAIRLHQADERDTQKTREHDEEAHTYMSKNYPTTHLTESEKEQISDYTGSGSEAYTNLLRRPLVDRVKDHAELVYKATKHYPDNPKAQAAFIKARSSEYDTPTQIKNLHQLIKDKGHELKEEQHVYSGLGYDPTHIFNEKNGIFHSPSFISSSTGVRPVSAFAHGHNYKTSYSELMPRSGAKSKLRTLTTSQDQHILHFHLPKGFKNGMYIANISQHPGEKEFLLNKDQKWKLVNYEIVHKKISSRDRVFNTPHIGTRYEHTKATSNQHIWTVVPHDV